MADRLSEMKERSQKRKELLAKLYGLQNPKSLKSVLKVHDDHDDPQTGKKQKIGFGGADQSAFSAVTSPAVATSSRSGPKNKDGEEDFETEEVYTDSSAFLKGTQSENPHNDYCQHFVDTGERPQNFIRDAGLANRFEEYPKQRELIRLKDDLISQTSTPPMYLQADLETFNLHELDCKFDVILVEPPFEEYQRTHGVVFDKYWDWDEIESLDIPSLAAQRSFLWLWCGNAEGLERGRQCMKRWGFRRCEDICWIRTNIKHPGHNKNLQSDAVFQRTKEHCLMGIKGTVKRNTDGDFIHANVDIDLIIDEEPEYGSKDKPVEIFHIIEHFCLGRRRLHLFGRDSTIRPGWLSVGPGLTSSNFDPQTYNNFFSSNPMAFLTGCTDDIERLRPKSPPPKMAGGSNSGDRGGGGMRGRGGGRGGSGGGSGSGMMGAGGSSSGGGGGMRGGGGGRGGGGRDSGAGGMRGRGGGMFRGGGRGGRGGGMRDDYRDGGGMR